MSCSWLATANTPAEATLLRPPSRRVCRLPPKVLTMLEK
jgi:hypothetical protein